jgi:uncharacterized RDD family membrane protein YckC
MPCKNHPLVEEPLVRCARCGESFCPNCIVEIRGTPYCAVCKGEILGDLRSGRPATGPDVAATGLDLASIGRRTAALFLDWLVLGFPLMLLLFIISFVFYLHAAFVGQKVADRELERILRAVIILSAFVSWVLYEGLMLPRNGQTVGKKAMRIKVVSAGGGPLSQGQAFGRAVVRQVLLFVPCLGLVNYLTVFGPQRTCIHDLAARTRVVNWNA